MWNSRRDPISANDGDIRPGCSFGRLDRRCPDSSDEVAHVEYAAENREQLLAPERLCNRRSALVLPLQLNRRILTQFGAWPVDLRSRIAGVVAGCVNGAIVEEECVWELESPVLDHQGPLENRSAVQVAVCRAMGRGLLSVGLR